jgi:hypothetical protein
VVAQKQKQKTVAQLVTERMNEGRRWKDDPEGSSTPASALDPSFDDGDEADLGQDNTHRFEAMVDEIARRDGVSKTEATRRARKEFPTLFADYQASAAVSKSYGQLIRDEIQKGCNAVVAAQRVAVAYPALARQTLAKRESGVAEFMMCVSEIKKRDGVSRVEAMTRARQENPTAFERFQNV